MASTVLAFFLLLLPNSIPALPLGPDNSNAVAVVWTFPNETWIENLAIRQNGAALCTSINRAAIYQVDPFNHVAVTVHQFALTDSTLGIAEVENDVFVVVSANISLATNTAWPGSAKIWRVDMAAWSLDESNAVSLIASLPDIVLPDGVTALNYDRGTVLVADAYKGIVWRVDTTTGAYSIAIKDPLFRVTNPEIPLGVDGIHVLDNELYFTNFAANLVGKIPITDDGSAASLVQNVTSTALFPDDFCLAADGTAYVAGYNTLWRVGPNGHTTPLVGGPNSTVVQGITSAQLGRTRDDQNVLYMGTEGGIFFTPPGAEIHGGQLLAVNIGLFE